MDDAMGLGEEQRSPRRWRWPFTWLGLLALCWVIYELTRQPALGAVAVCLKFGWEDFSTARWLRRRDPDRARGRSCSWLYFAWGLWKTAIVAFVMSVAFAAVAPNRLAQGGAADALLAFALTFATTLIAFAISTLATFLAVALAWRNGLRLWLDRAVHEARRTDCWPPSLLCEGRTNRISQLLLTSVALVVFAVVLVCLSMIAVAPLWPAGWVALIPFLLSLLAPLVICLMRQALADRIAAPSAYHCWAEEPEERNEGGFEAMRW